MTYFFESSLEHRARFAVLSVTPTVPISKGQRRKSYVEVSYEVVFNLFVHLRKVGKKHKVFGATQRTGEHIRLPSVIAREDTWIQCGSVYLIMCGLFGNLGHAAEWRNK